jgi:integrase
MALTSTFISFDYDHDEDLKTLLVGQAKNPDSPFWIADQSIKELNATCLHVLQHLEERAARLGFTQPDHFVFPWHGRNKRLDATRPMASWRTASRSMRKAAGLSEVRFHDGRHTAITTLAEKGLPDWEIQAQVGPVSPDMMKTYSP